MLSANVIVTVSRLSTDAEVVLGLEKLLSDVNAKAVPELRLPEYMRRIAGDSGRSATLTP